MSEAWAAALGGEPGWCTHRRLVCGQAMERRPQWRSD